MIDKQFTKTPFYGVSRMVKHLREAGHKVNPKRICRLYRIMDLHVIWPRLNTCKAHKGKDHTIYPYLLRDVKIEKPNQIWAMEITYIPVEV
ncbi:IS3 family transposase [Thermophagus sp. OGC60D27]|uniref:IS3 family transposase n=1 Tax=Thermophagus sp. OGC60D27 TaxID=3458415 RepID=UPI0040382E0C